MSKKKKKPSQRKPSGARPNKTNVQQARNDKPVGPPNPPRTKPSKPKVTTRSGNPELAAKAREIEKKKEQKLAAKRKPKAVGEGFRKFSQISIVVLILGSLILSGLGTITTMNNNRNNEADNSAPTLYDVDGNPLNGDPVGPVEEDEIQWSEVDGLSPNPEGVEIDFPEGESAEAPVEIPFEIPAGE